MPYTSVRHAQKTYLRGEVKVSDKALFLLVKQKECQPLKYCSFSQKNETAKISSYQHQSCSIRSFHQILLSNLQHKQQF